VVLRDGVHRWGNPRGGDQAGGHAGSEGGAGNHSQVARALNAATQHGLVHRDIKPANLMLVQEDNEVLAKVIDFGLAKTLAAEGEDALTLSMGGFVGTAHFASPEQLEEREIDVRSDIYSLGVTLWYMLAGKPPFGGSMAQVMSQHLSKPPPFERVQDIACHCGGPAREDAGKRSGGSLSDAGGTSESDRGCPLKNARCAR
jgi:serine/threonine protein kinase